LAVLACVVSFSVFFVGGRISKLNKWLTNQFQFNVNWMLSALQFFADGGRGLGLVKSRLVASF
jgi:hypothetical protein